MHFPCTSDGHIKGTVSVLSNDDISYAFPMNTMLVSSIYHISANKPFPLPVTAKVKHCVPLDDDNATKQLCFVTASIEQGRPYKFRMLKYGCFVPGSDCGEIRLNHFSIIAIMKFKLGIPVSFHISVFYPQSDKVDVVVTKALPEHFQVRH